MSCSKEILISEVQSRPILWQDTNKHFKNKSVTDKLWAEVGLACGVEGKAKFEVIHKYKVFNHFLFVQQ